MDAVPAQCLDLLQSRWGDSRVLPQLGRLVQAILDANRRMNLTADGDPAAFWVRHIEDALWLARLLEEARGRPGGEDRLLDVGSGAGLPGLVLAILWPGVRVELLEARLRRAVFLRTAVSMLGLEHVRVIADRAETLAHRSDHREIYTIVTARALAPMPSLLELTLPFVRIDGLTAAVKSAGMENELAQAERALATLGGRSPFECKPYRRSDGKACQVCLARKIAPTPAAYPRRPGVPERRPLI